MAVRSDSDLSYRLQRNLSICSAAGVLLVSVMVALISIIPLYTKLKASQEQDLQSNLSTRLLAVNQSLDRTIDIANQISARTRAYQLLDGYQSGQVSFTELKTFTINVFSDAMKETALLKGISRFDGSNHLIAKVGMPVPASARAQLKMEDLGGVSITGPIALDGKLHLVITTTILSEARRQIGHDITIFDLSEFQKIASDYSGLGDTGEMVLAYDGNGDVEFFFPRRNGRQVLFQRPSGTQDPPLMTLLKLAIAQDKTELIHHSGQVITVTPVPGTNWAIALVINSQELYASVNQDLIVVGLLVLGLSGVATTGIIVLFRPLIKRVIDADELAKEVVAKTLAFEELKQAQLQLVQAEKMSSLGQLVAGIAHEINNPMNFIHGNLFHLKSSSENLLEISHFLLNQYPSVPPDIEDKLEDLDYEYIKGDLPDLIRSMQVGSKRIREIVLSLRNFSRLDESNLKPVDIHEGIDSTLLLLQNRIKPRPDYPKIEVVKVYGDLPEVECYASQLNQVFMNLLVNAIDALESCIANYRSQGIQMCEPMITITTLMSDNQCVLIKIADNGSGIPEEVYRRLFEPFFTTKPAGKGTGLGLSISQQIIQDNHGGRLYCHTQPQKGTEFIVELPLRQGNHHPSEKYPGTPAA